MRRVMYDMLDHCTNCNSRTARISTPMSLLWSRLASDCPRSCQRGMMQRSSSFSVYFPNIAPPYLELRFTVLNHFKGWPIDTISTWINFDENPKKVSASGFLFWESGLNLLFLKIEGKKDINVALDNIYLGVVWISRGLIGIGILGKVENFLTCSHKIYQSAIDSVLRSTVRSSL